MNFKPVPSLLQAATASAVAFGLNSRNVAALSNPMIVAVATAALFVKASAQIVDTTLRKIDLFCANSGQQKLHTKESAAAANKANKGVEGYQDVSENDVIDGQFLPDRDSFSRTGQVASLIFSAVIAFATLTAVAQLAPAAAVSSALYAAGGIALGRAVLETAAEYAPDKVKNALV